MAETGHPVKLAFCLKSRTFPDKLDNPTWSNIAAGVILNQSPIKHTEINLYATDNYAHINGIKKRQNQPKQQHVRQIRIHQQNLLISSFRHRPLPRFRTQSRRICFLQSHYTISHLFCQGSRRCAPRNPAGRDAKTGWKSPCKKLLFGAIFLSKTYCNSGPRVI